MKCECNLSYSRQVQSLPNSLRPRFLVGLAPAELEAVIATARHREFKAGTVLIREGYRARRLFLLTSGRGHHFVVTRNGRKLLLHWMTRGQIVGATAMLAADVRYLASAEVLVDSCALVWDTRAIRECAERFPVLLDNMLVIAYIEHVAWLVSAQISLVDDDARGRLAHLLLSLAVSIGRPMQGGGTELDITNEELADGAYTTHYTVSRVLSDWQRAGALVKGYGKVMLRKPQLLAPASAAAIAHL